MTPIFLFFFILIMETMPTNDHTIGFAGIAKVLWWNQAHLFVINKLWTFFASNLHLEDRNIMAIYIGCYHCVTLELLCWDGTGLAIRVVEGTIILVAIHPLIIL